LPFVNCTVGNISRLVPCKWLRRRAKRAVTRRTVQSSELNLFGSSVETDPETLGGIELGAGGTVFLPGKYENESFPVSYAESVY